MMQLFLVMVLAFYASNVFAKDSKKPRKPAQTSISHIAVTPTDEDFDVDGLKREGISIQPRHEISKKEQIIAPRERDFIFQKAGILQSVSKWDDLEKDILLLRAKNYSLQDLKAKYPKINPAYLTKLQQVAGKN